MSGAEIVPLRATTETSTLEETVLGAVLDLPDKVELMDLMGLTPESFENPRLGMAWKVARALASRGREVTAITVASSGKNHGMLSDADAPWLTALQAANSLTRSAALQVAEDVRGRARGRGIEVALLNAVESIRRGRFHPGRLSGELEAILYGLATDFSRDETAEPELLKLNATWDSNAAEGKSTLDPTGIRVLDSIIAGLPQNLTFIHGKPGIGKNIVATSMIRAQLERDPSTKTGLFWLEDGTQALLKRWQAEDLGIPLREVGWKKLDAEKAERKVHVDAHLYGLLKRIVHYQHDSISRAELKRRALQMIYTHKVNRIVIDNMKEIDHRDPRAKYDYWQGVAETTRVMRNLGRDCGVPVIMLVHDTEETSKPGHEGPPDPRKMTGGQAGGDRARLVLGVWKKGQSLRITVTKANDISEAGLLGPTVELKRNFEAGTIVAEAGTVIDLKAEEAKDRREKKAQSREESVDERLAREALLKSKKAKLASENPEPKPEEAPPPQASLPLGEKA